MEITIMYEDVTITITADHHIDISGLQDFLYSLREHWAEDEEAEEE